MAIRGKKPKPHNLKVLAGTDRPDRGAPDAPQFDIVDQFPEPPQHLNMDGVDMWNRLGPELVNAKVLQTVDLFALEQLCSFWQCYRRKVKADMQPTAAETSALRCLFAEFGATPASRLRSSGSESNAGNKFASNGKRP